MKLPRLLQPSSSRGVKSEQTALVYLKKQGLSLVCQNFYCRFGEIDLIMSDKDTLVFIEVRYRKNDTFGGALASIGAIKQRKIINTARYYIAQLDTEPYCRFDAFALNQAGETQWIKDAFQV